MRFFVAMSRLPHPMAARFTQIDYDREMALVLTEPAIRERSSASFGFTRTRTKKGVNLPCW